MIPIAGFCLKRTDEQIVIEVSDNGKGVPEDKLPHIFEQFYRGDEARGSKYEGNELGLYVCWYIVMIDEGRIQAYNENRLHIQITLPEMVMDEQASGEREHQEKK